MHTSTLFKSLPLLKSLYFSFVLSKLEYACVVWSPIYVCYQLAIEKIQRRFLKFMSFKTYGAYPPRNVDYDFLLSTHNISSLVERRKIHGAHFIWKLLHNFVDCPEILSHINLHVPRLNVRHASTFNFPTPRTNVLKKSPMVIMCRDAEVFYNDIFSEKL